MSFTRFCVAVAACVIAAGPVAGETITTKSLIAEMTDLAALAEFPEPAFTTGQFSSYDRRSKSPDNADDWFANGDACNYLRVEERDGRQEHVMMDTDGPGAIVRIWSANPYGTLRFYLDHSETPTWQVPMADLLAGKLPALPEPIGGVRAAGQIIYFPIPYAKHCKLTCSWEEGNGFYYIVNYRTYGAETDVQTFRPTLLTELAPEIRAYAERLSHPAKANKPPADADVKLSPRATLAPGQTAIFAAYNSGGAIVDLQVKVEGSDLERTLRQSIIRMTFDGTVTVEAPLGDFFGSAPGLNEYVSLPMGIQASGKLSSRWFMPFKSSATIEIANYAAQPLSASMRATTTAYEWNARSMYFHAKWRAQGGLVTRPIIDWNYCDLTGTGAVVGAAFHVSNPVKNWWGEGDEKIYVDGEDFPSFFGTGTEDYYGYAWCNPTPFAHAFHNQTRADGPGNYGHSSVNRWHIIDRIPFRKSLRFDMEIWHHIETTIDAAVTAYWYARPGAKDKFKPLGKEDLLYRPIAPYEVPHVAGAIEGEKMRIIEHTTELGPQEVGACSSERHLWWRDAAQPGDRMIVGFNVENAGCYRVFGRFVKSFDYAIVQCAINDENAGPKIDLYHPSVTVSKEIDLGVFELQAGENRFQAEIVGINDKSAKKYMFGLDYLRLEPVE